MITLIGTLISGYLSYTHFKDITPICYIGGANSCSLVMQSSYSILFGVPIALLGLITWLSLFIFTLHVYNHHRKNHGNIHKTTSRMIFAIASVGIFAAGYFNQVMFLKLKAVCMWCEISHVLMIVAFFTAYYLAYGLNKKNWFRSALFVFVILFGLPFLFSLFVVSNPDKIELAKCLTDKNVKMYGAFWCPHCADQKNLFGRQAFEKINYVECADPAEPKKQLQVCTDAGIKGYPTWTNAQDERLSGAYPLESLKKWAGC